MKTKPSILIIIFFILCNLYSYNVQSQKISKEQAFFYFAKIYNYSVTTPVKSGGGYSQCGDDLLTHYAYIFDNFNYMQSRNDEFKKHEYTKSITAKFNTGIASVNFEKKFTVSCQGSFGEYSFENSSFPIKFTENEYRIVYRIPFYKDDCFMEINVGEIKNISNFNWVLAYPVDKARNFIANRKYSDGQINRTIYFKLTYSIVNQTSFSANYMTNLNGSNIIINLHSIDVYNDENLTDKLGTINSTNSKSDDTNKSTYKFFSINRDQMEGKWEGKIKAVGSTITIEGDMFTWKKPDGSLIGFATTLDPETQTQEEIDNMLRNFKRSMSNNNLTICNKNLVYVPMGNDVQPTILILFFVEGKLFAWESGDRYYEKK